MKKSRSTSQWMLDGLMVSLLAAGALVLSACASLPEPQGPPRKENVLAVNERMELLRFNAGQPGVILDRRPLRGLAAGERIVGIDFRVARGVLYALSQMGRLYTVDPARGDLRPVVGAPIGLPLPEPVVGFDFNPAADRIRLVLPNGINARLHPDTGAMVDSNPDLAGTQTDGTLTYEAGDRHAGVRPQLVAAAYTYNKRDEKLTTNYAIDRATGHLVMQGSLEGLVPVVSPNTGRLRSVGSLGLAAIADAAFDISDLDNTPLAAIRTTDSAQTALYLVDLISGRAQRIGRIDDGSPIVGLAIEP